MNCESLVINSYSGLFVKVSWWCPGNYNYGMISLLLLAPLLINNNNELVANLQAQQCYDNSHFTEWFLPKMKNVTWDLLKYHRIEKEQRCV